MRFVTITIFIFACCFPLTTLAHQFDYGALKTNLLITGNTIHSHITVPQKIGVDVTDTQTEQQLMTDYLSQSLSASLSGDTCTFTASSTHTETSDTQSEFYGDFNCPREITDIRSLHIHNTVFSDAFANYDNFTSFHLHGEEWTFVFSPTNTDYPANTPALLEKANTPATETTSSTTPEPSASSTMDTIEKRFEILGGQFFRSGIMHIWTGMDHLLFLLGLILLQRSVRNILILITSFTIAHSLTFLLAGFHIVSLSPRIVEPLIALTVAYVALRNLLLLKNIRITSKLPEWSLAFGFGLIHGLGFAATLTEAHIPGAFFIPALILFNLGIEFGQASFVLLLLQALSVVDKRKRHQEILMGASILMFFVALYWFVERIIS